MRLQAETSYERGNPLMLAGVKHGRLTAIEPTGETSKEGRLWRCRCDCGTVVERAAKHFASGGYASCGCAQREAAAAVCRNRATHGATGTRLYNIWRSMHARCSNSKAINFADYGGRGISVCEEWGRFKVFQQWAESAGYRDGLSIERKRNEEGYSPNNCEWATAKRQARNRRSNRVVECGGVARTVAEWSEISGIGSTTILYRLNEGWPPNSAIYEVPNRGRRFA